MTSATSPDFYDINRVATSLSEKSDVEASMSTLGFTSNVEKMTIARICLKELSNSMKDWYVDRPVNTAENAAEYADGLPELRSAFAQHANAKPTLETVAAAAFKHLAEQPNYPTALAGQTWENATEEQQGAMMGLVAAAAEEASKDSGGLANFVSKGTAEDFAAQYEAINENDAG